MKTRRSQPLSGAEIARRAETTTESFRKNQTGFVIADLLREVPEGWRLSLSFADERDTHDVLPWFFIDDLDDRPHVPSVDLRVTEDVLYELAESVVDDLARFGDPDDILYRAFGGLPDLGDPAVIVDHRGAALNELCDEWPWLQSILPFVKAACESPESDPNATPVLMGPTISQQPLTTTSAGAAG